MVKVLANCGEVVDVATNMNIIEKVVRGTVIKVKKLVKVEKMSSNI